MNARRRFWAGFAAGALAVAMAGGCWLWSLTGSNRPHKHVYGRWREAAPMKGKGLHAEMALMKKYGARIKTIIICRVGNSGNLLPIDPCSACAELAGKLGITIVSIEP